MHYDHILDWAELKFNTWCHTKIYDSVLIATTPDFVWTRPKARKSSLQQVQQVVALPKSKTLEDNFKVYIFIQMSNV